MKDSSVRIGQLLPNVLSTYSDAGNATVLAQRLRWRGIGAEIVPITAQTPPPASCDLYVIGGGEDGAQTYAAQWLRSQRALHAALRTAPVLAVCAGLQVLGRWFEDAAGSRQAGLELLDLTTSPGHSRAVGEMLIRCALPGVGTLTGFENHSGITRLGPDVTPLGEVLRGTGNGTGADGVITGNIYGTYLHGPVLARNPAFADWLLHKVVGALQPLQLPDQQAVRQLRLQATAAHPLHLRGLRAVLTRAGTRRPMRG